MPDPEFEDFLRRVDELQSRWNFVRKGMVELMTTMKEQRERRRKRFRDIEIRRGFEPIADYLKTRRIRSVTDFLYGPNATTTS